MADAKVPSGGASRARGNQPRRRPNVVVIIMDDLAYGDLACHGNPHTQTPHLDCMHAQSTRFTQACSGLVCTPARAMLMTGRYAYRTRAIDTYNGRTTIDPSEITLAQILRDQGYATCLSGKWHLGDNAPSRPQDLGFDEVLMHNGGGLRQPANYGHWQQDDSYDNPLLNHNGKLEKRAGYCTDIFTDHALGFIEQHREQPFFVYLATNAPHAPLDVPDQWLGRYAESGLPENFARVYAMVDNIDHNVGRVQRKLQDMGLREDTIVIYTSDHGPCGSAMHEGLSRFNCGLRSRKGTPYEGGVRVPFFWQWDGVFKADRDVDRVVSQIDFLPTLAKLCDARVPDDRTIDGVDLSPLLLDQCEISAWPDRAITLQWHRGDAPRPFVNCMTRTQRWKLVEGRELYDLCADPEESCDVAADYPEVVGELRHAYEQWFADVSSEHADNYTPPAIHLGTDAENPVILNRNDRRSHGADSWREDETFGHWVVARPPSSRGRFDVTVEFMPLERDGRVMLLAGLRCWVAPVSAGEASVVLRDVEIESGRQRIEALACSSDGSFGARYVILQGLDVSESG